MRPMICTFGLLLVAIAASAAEPKSFVSVTDSRSKAHVGPIIEETPAEIAIRDLKEDVEFRAAKDSLKKIEKDISDEGAIRIVGIAPVVAYRVSELAGQEIPTGKVIKVSQSVVYINLGTASGAYVGQKLNVFRKSAEIRDPDTNELLGVERPKLGVLELTEIQKAYSKGRVVSESEIDLKPADEVEFQGASEARIAVLPLRTEKGERFDVSESLSEELITKLAQRKITILERSLLDRVIAEQAWQNTIFFEPDNVQRLGHLTGATVVITGKIVAKEKMGTAFVRLIDVRTGKILYAVSGSLSLANAKVISGPRTAAETPDAKNANPADLSGKTVKLGKGKGFPPEWIGPAFTVEKNGGGIRFNGAVISRDKNFLKRDFVFETVISLRHGDNIAVVGIGDNSKPAINPPYAFKLRIHPPGLSNGEVYVTQENETLKVPGSAMPRPGTHLFRISKEGDSVTFQVDVDNDGPSPDDSEHTFNIRDTLPNLHEKNTYLFFGGGGVYHSVLLKVSK